MVFKDDLYFKILVVIMKFKKIMLITLLLLAVLTVGAVSAADDGAAEDLAVDDVGGGDLADTPIKDADLLSNDDEGDGDDGDDDGSGEGDEIDYQVDAVTEFYINNESNVVFSLVCPDEAIGKFVVDVTKDVENSDPEYINTFEHPILESEWGKQINFTVGELGITQNGFYNFELYHLQNDGDECNDDTYIDDFGADAFDSTEFRIVDTFDEADVNALAVNIPVFGLYCPDGHEGIVTVTVRLDRDEVALITNNTRQKNDDNLIYWYIPELNLTSFDSKYTINVKVNDDEFEEEWDVWFNNPVSFGEYSYVNMSDIFVNVEVPSEIEDGRIIIEVDGSVVFNKTLSEFPSTNDEFDYYYWHPPYHGSGEGDLRFKLYRIHNDVIEDAEAKEYNVTASLILDKREFIYNGSYALRVPNIAENDGVSIQLINYTSFDMDDDWAEIAYISAPEGADGIVIVSSGDDILFEENFYDLTDGGDFYLLRAGELDIREPGEYEITFAYWNGDELVVENTATFYFYENDYNDADDGVIIWVSDGDEKEFDLDSEDDLNTPFAFVSVQNDLNGRIVIMVWAGEEGDEQEFFAKDLEQITNKEDDPDNEGFTIYKISLNDLGNYNDLIECGGFKLAFINDEENDEIDSRSYNINHDEGIVTFWEDNENDADDGVIIYVPNGDDAGYDLGNEEDLNTPFAFVSVQNDLNGRIVIMVWNDEEGDEQEFFGIGLEDIVNKEDDPDNDGFTIYMISLNDLGNYEDLIDCGSFKLAFINDEDDEIDSRSYNIDNDEGIVMFWENDDEEEEEGIHGEGEEIEAEFTDANILNNDVVVTIPKENVPEDADNEFTVVILQEDEEPKEITFRLDKILEGDNYIIRVNDLQLPEFRENYGLFMFLQFYSGGEKAYYAEYWDDEFGIHIYESPCIFNEISILYDDEEITIQEIPEGVDEFTIIVSKQGSEDIVKTFKFSEIVEDMDDVWVSFKLSDLGITETGDYIIAVKYSDDLIYSGNLTVNKNVDIRTYEWDDEDEELKTFDSVDQLVANFRISESVTGYVKIYVNGTQVGENINLSDLRMGEVAPEDGRQIILNDLNITESGKYPVKLELYSDADELWGDVEFDILVEVGENSVEISEGAHPYGTEATDETIGYTIGSPLSENQYFNIYFNGIKAGTITSEGLEFNDEFTVPMFDVLLFKPGNYDVNVTFFDGENETDVTTGSFSINELTLTSDKEVYVYDKDSIIISFNMDSVADEDSLRAYYVYDWGPVYRDDEMVFNPYGGDAIKEDGLYNDGVISFDVAWIIDEDGDVHFTLNEGTTLIYVTYENETGKYGGFIEVNVVEAPEPVDPELSIDSVSDVEEGVNVTITIHALGNFTGSVKVLVGDVEVGSVAVSAGSGTFTIPAGNLTVGLNTVKITSEANENFTAGEANVAFNVTAKVIPPVVLDPNLTISVDDIREGTNAVIVITTNDTFSGIVKVQIGTGNYNVSVINGTGSYSVPGLAVGNHTATATFEATEAFNASTKNATFKVNKEVVPDAETSISTGSASVSSKNPVYSIKLNPDATGTLRVKIGNNTYTQELKDGEATIEVTDLPAGTYEAVVSYSGDAKYAPISKTVNSTVKAETAIKATAVTTTYGTSKNIVITLIDANGNAVADKQVTVVLNGVSKTLTTDAKGQATYAIGTKLAVKKYDATVTFAGDDGYVKSTGTAKVTVNKAKSVLTAKKKTFKVKKAKKYTVTLKTDKKKALKKVKVTLTGKFKGKKIKITVKTDKKGKATFNLKKLTKKGKFTVTIKFAGNKYYKAASKKAKITVK